MIMGESILPEKENLRRAVRWISEQGTFSVKVVDEASLRFDLSPADAAFLLRALRRQERGVTERRGDACVAPTSIPENLRVTDH